MSTVKVETIGGHVLVADVSEAACSEFGFKPTERIRDCNDRQGEVIGVASMPEDAGCVKAGEKILLIALDGMAGKVCFFPNPKVNLTKVS